MHESSIFVNKNLVRFRTKDGIVEKINSENDDGIHKGILEYNLVWRQNEGEQPDQS